MMELCYSLFFFYNFTIARRLGRLVVLFINYILLFLDINRIAELIRALMNEGMVVKVMNS